MDCGHEGENGFLVQSSYGFIQNPTDPRCIHCAWNELHEFIPEDCWLDRIYFLLGGWGVEVGIKSGSSFRTTGKTPAEALDNMKLLLKEQHAK